MAWVRIHDGAMQNLKITALSDSAFRLWVRGLAYCQTALTDGLIPRTALREMGARRKDVQQLSAPQVEGRAPLWEPHDIGFKVHNYLFWNDSKEAVEDRQRLARHRRAFMDDPTLRTALKDRDGDACRYCGRAVNWRDRKGMWGATYDHVDPRGPATLANLVIACRSCNSAKRNRTPEQAGMSIRPVPSQINQGQDLDIFKGTKPNQTKPVEEKTVQTPAPSLFDDFWAAYPKKKAKDDARKAWDKRRPDAALTQVILRALHEQSQSREWRQESGRYIPFPATWLNRGQWTDSAVVEAKPEVQRYEWHCTHEPKCPHRAACEIVSLRVST